MGRAAWWQQCLNTSGSDGKADPWLQSKLDGGAHPAPLAEPALLRQSFLPPRNSNHPCRYEDYDARKLVDCYLNLPEVQASHRTARWAGMLGKALCLLVSWSCSCPGAAAGAGGAAAASFNVNHSRQISSLQEELGVQPGSRYAACSPAVGAALGPDVMQSVRRLIPDLLEAYPLLLYQGEFCVAGCCPDECKQCVGLDDGDRCVPCIHACTPRPTSHAPPMYPGTLNAPALHLTCHAGAHDAQDGPTSNEAWMAALEWGGAARFAAAQCRIIRANDVCSGVGWQAKGISGSGWESSLPSQIDAGPSSGSGARLALPGRDGSSSSSGGMPAKGARPMQQRRLLMQTPAGTEGGREQVAETAAAEPHGSSSSQVAGGSSSSSGCKATGNPVVGFWKQGGGLTHVVLTDAGHMAPRDAPQATQWMFERWAAAVAA